MPYINEKANPKGYAEVISNEYVKERLKTFKDSRLVVHEKIFDPKNIKHATELKKTDHNITHIVAIDGSNAVITPDNNNIELGFIKIGVVLENLKKLKLLNTQEKVTIENIQNCYKTYSLETIIPGKGIIDDKLSSSKDKFRLEVLESMKNLKIDPIPLFKNSINEESLLDILKALENKNSNFIECLNCKTKQAINEISETIQCKKCKNHIYYSDILSLHGRMNMFNDNTPYNEVMSTFERILMMGLLMKASKSSQAFNRTAFITDGPLAFFTSKEISEQVLDFYQTLEGPILFGIEKTGTFVNFANTERLDKKLPNNSIFMISNETLRLITNNQNESYGKTAFYGKRFFYKTVRGDKIFVITIPPVVGTPYNENESDDWYAYPQLYAIIKLIEESSTDMFGLRTPAITSIAKANEIASIPKRLGEIILKDFTVENFEKTKN